MILAKHLTNFDPPLKNSITELMLLQSLLNEIIFSLVFLPLELVPEHFLVKPSRHL